MARRGTARHGGPLILSPNLICSYRSWSVFGSPPPLRCLKAHTQPRDALTPHRTSAQNFARLHLRRTRPAHTPRWGREAAWRPVAGRGWPGLAAVAGRGWPRLAEAAPPGRGFRGALRGFENGYYRAVGRGAPDGAADEEGEARQGRVRAGSAVDAHRCTRQKRRRRGKERQAQQEIGPTFSRFQKMRAPRRTYCCRAPHPARLHTARRAGAFQISARIHSFRLSRGAA